MVDSSSDSSDDLEQSRAIKDLFGRGILYTVIYSVQSIVAILVTPIITRELGPSEYGTVALVMLVGQVIGGIAGLGLSIGIQREFADEEGPQNCRGLIVTGTILTFVVLAAFLVASPLWKTVIGLRSANTTLELGVLWAGFSAAGLTVTSLIRAQDRIRLFTITIGVQCIGSQLAGLIMMAIFERKAEYYFLGLLAGQAIGTLLGFSFVRPSFRLISLRVARKALSFSLPIVPHGLAFMILALGDRIVVQHDLGGSAVGRYQIAYNAAATIIVLLAMLNQAWEPRIFAIKTEVELKSVLSAVRSHLYRLQIPLILAIVFSAPLMLRILAPDSFRPNGLLLVVSLVACSAFPFSAYLANLRVLLASRRTRPMVWASPLCAAANILLNIALVPVIGINGSALATIISYALLGGVTGLIARRMLTIERVQSEVWIGISVAMGVGIGAAYIPGNAYSITAESFLAALCGVWAFVLFRRILDVGGRGPRHKRRRLIGRGLHDLFIGGDLEPAKQTGG